MTYPLQIFVENRGRPPELAASATTLDAALAALDALGKSWAATKPGRKCLRLGTMRVMRYSDGKMAAVAFVDPCPAPAGPEKGQIPVKPRAAK